MNYNKKQKRAKFFLKIGALVLAVIMILGIILDLFIW